MKIAMVSEHASPLAAIGGVDAGGQNVHVAALASALARRGHRVVVYTRRDSPDLPAHVPLCPGVVVEHLDAGPPEPIGKDELLPHIPQLGCALAERLDDDPPAVVHGHFWMSGLAALQASCSVPVVQTFHALGTVKRRFQGRADTSPRSRLRLERRVARRVERIVATCTDEVRELVRMGADRSLIDVVPCGVDLERFTPDGPAVPRGGSPRLLAVGRLVPRKGVDDVILALSRIPDAELLVAGGPPGGELARDPEAKRLTALAAQAGVSHRVRLLGQVPHAELPALIRSADLVVCLPWYEPFGIVPLEAMACGVPVVAAAVGGMIDTVVDGVTGALLPPRRPDLFAAVVTDLLADPDRRRRYGRAGPDRVRRLYRWEQVARSTERSYLLAAAHSRPAAEALEAG
jgi:D-inositol-3-phosphate glycosyltransferase